MAAVMDCLTWLRDALAAVSGVQSCRIGFEPELSTDAYPLIRIVPMAVTRSGQVTTHQIVRQIEVTVYVGVARHDFENPADPTDATGTEGLWRELFGLEKSILDALPTTGAYSARWLETMTDETLPEAERNPAFRMLGMRMLVIGLA